MMWNRSDALNECASACAIKTIYLYIGGSNYYSRRLIERLVPTTMLVPS